MSLEWVELGELGRGEYFAEEKLVDGKWEWEMGVVMNQEFIMDTYVHFFWPADGRRITMRPKDRHVVRMPEVFGFDFEGFMRLDLRENPI